MVFVVCLGQRFRSCSVLDSERFFLGKFRTSRFWRHASRVWSQSQVTKGLVHIPVLY